MCAVAVRGGGGRPLARTARRVAFLLDGRGAAFLRRWLGRSPGRSTAPAALLRRRPERSPGQSAAPAALLRWITRRMSPLPAKPLAPATARRPPRRQQLRGCLSSAALAATPLPEPHAPATATSQRPGGYSSYEGLGGTEAQITCQSKLP